MNLYNYLTNDNWIHIALYWSFFVSIICNSIEYTRRTVLDYIKDVKAREEAKYYTPSLKISTIVARFLGAVLPVINVWCFFFDVLADIFSVWLGTFFEWFWNVLDIPLVPKKPD
jgi:hypothetical protein